MRQARMVAEVCRMVGVLIFAGIAGASLSTLLPTGLVEVHGSQGEVTVYLDTAEKRYGLYVGESGYEWSREGGLSYFSCNEKNLVNCPYLDTDTNQE